MRQKRILIFTACFVVVFFAFVLSAATQELNPDPPRNVTLEPDIRSVTIEWDKVDDAEEYYIYWGMTSDLEGERITVDDLRYTMAELTPDTEYFFQVSAEVAFFGESEKSDIRSVKTLSEETIPVPPDNFWITDPGDITENSVSLSWDAPVQEEVDGEVDSYRIHYGTVAGEYSTYYQVDGSKTKAMVDDLDSNARYYFNIEAIYDETDEAMYSAMAGEIIVDTLPDEHPPDTPEPLDGTLTDDQEITINIDAGRDNNDKMVDYAGVTIYYGQTPGEPDDSIDAGRADAHVFTDLPLDTTWYFTAAAYDFSGNESEPADEISIRVEDIASYTTTSDDDFSGGCFIQSLFNDQRIQEPSYDTSRHKNRIGLSGGYYLPHQAEFDDFYGTDNYPVFLFYERDLHRYLAIDFKAGYMRSAGHLRTAESDVPTRIDATFTMIPTMASVNAKFPLAPYVWGFVGIGPDYWYIRETSDLDALADTNRWVGGYHGRAGIWLYNTDIQYRRWGMLLETQYSVIDKFGENDMDLGGWLFLIGGFYSF